MKLEQSCKDGAAELLMVSDLVVETKNDAAEKAKAAKSEIRHVRIHTGTEMTRVVETAREISMHFSVTCHLRAPDSELLLKLLTFSPRKLK